MRKRKLLVVLAGLVVVLCAAGAFIMWPRPDRVTRDNFGHIKQGMTLAAVEEILGPPGDYTTGPAIRTGVSAIRDTSPWVWRPGAQREWKGDEGVLTVVLDLNDTTKISTAGFEPWLRFEQSPLEGLAWRAKRQWHRWFPK